MRESVPSHVLITVLRPAFAAACVAWALLLGLAPFLASRPHATPSATALLVAVYAIGGAICHQLAERSYRLWTAQMPVCARCAGIYAGAAIAAIFWSVAQGFQRFGHRHRSPERLALQTPERRALQTPERRAPQTPGPRALLLVAVFPTLATLVYEWTTGRMPAHWSRAVAGAALGAAAAWLVLSSMPRRAGAENQVN